MTDLYIWENKIKIERGEALKYMSEQHDHDKVTGFIKQYWDYLYIQFEWLPSYYKCHTKSALEKNEEHAHSLLFYTTLTEKGKEKVLALLQERT